MVSPVAQLSSEPTSGTTLDSRHTGTSVAGRPRIKSIKLNEHVGHQVTLTGSAHPESKAQEKAEEKKEGHVEKAAGKEEYGDLRVTDLKMVSETCTN